jgi:hypothetical protein
MRTRLNRIFALLALFAIWTVTDAQTTKQTAKQPAVAAPTAATNAPPDLSGVWMAAPSGRPTPKDLHGIRETLAPDVDEADRFTFRHAPYPMQPWAEEKFNYNKDPENPYYHGRNELSLSAAMCAPVGPTIAWLNQRPLEIIQSAKRVLIFFESNHEIRQIWTDGRGHPKDFGHNWMGHSIGHWEGDTLVADTIGLNDLTWLDRAGHVHSDELHILERLQRVNPNKLVLNITFDDPKTLTIPWTARKTFELKSDWDLEELIPCEDTLLGKGLPVR